MKKLIFISLAFFVISCDEAIETKDNKTINENTEKKEEKISYANPRIIAGDSFGIFFQTLYRISDFDKMLAFTSKESVDKFGTERILDFYKNELKFGYDIGKGAISSGTDGDTVILNYSAYIMATETIIRIKVIVENDSTKIILPNNLKDFPS